MNQGYEKIFNYLRISHRVETAGQPRKKELQLIIKSGVEVVISLVPKGVNTEVPEEQQLFEQRGIVFERIPTEWEHITALDCLQCLCSQPDSRTPG